jgi:hypothetical protein
MKEEQTRRMEKDIERKKNAKGRNMEKMNKKEGKKEGVGRKEHG